MSYAVDITIRALWDVDEIVARIAKAAPKAAANWHRRLMEKVQSLQDNADSYPLADEADEFGKELREMLFGKRGGVWRVLCTIDGNKVFIWRVRHAARDRLIEDDL